MGVIIIHKPPGQDEPVIDFNFDAKADPERTTFFKENKASILAKVSDAIDRL